MWLNYSSRILKSLILLLSLHTVSFSAPYPKIWNVPAENPHFVGREDVLGDIMGMFKTTDHRIAVITGPQGFGKTQIAKRFVYKNFANYDVIWWFRANQYLKPQFEKFAQEMATFLKINIDEYKMAPPEQLCRVVKEAIRQKKLKCLIIFDDAPTYPEIEQYILFSHDNNIHTLITTKNGNFADKQIPVKPFMRENSLDYITQFLPDEPNDSKERLAIRFGDCPAALAVSIEYIKNYPGMTIDKYLVKHQEQKLTIPALPGGSKKLGSSIDEYETDLLAAIQMNMVELKQNSKEAYQLLGLLSLLHRDEIPVSLIETWAASKGIKTDIKELLSYILKTSLIEISTTPTGGTLSMQELLQSIVASHIPTNEKKMLIDQAAHVLKETFSTRTEKNIENVLKDNKPLLSTLKLSREADAISYQNSDLTIIRIRSLDLLVGMINDFPAAEELINHLEKDIQQNVKISPSDEVLYYANMALYSAICSPNYDKALPYGEKALKLAEAAGDLQDEELRILCNLIQHNCLVGLSDTATQYIEKAEVVFPKCQFEAYKTLFIIAKNLYLMDRADFQGVIDLNASHSELIKRQTFYPAMQYFSHLFVGEAKLKKGDVEGAQKEFSLSESIAREVHGTNENNMLFGRLYVLKGSLLYGKSKSFEEAVSSIKKGITIQDSTFRGSDKHKTQGFAHLQLGKLMHQNKLYEEAKAQYMQSEAIYDKILKAKKVDDVSDLYKQLTLLGVDTKDEGLTHTYMKKQIKTFGYDHFRTKDIMLYLDERGIVLPI